MFPGNSPYILKGTAFPANPQTGDLFFRTDLGFLCYYTGTEWLTVEEYSTSPVFQTFSANSSSIGFPNRSGYTLHVTHIEIATNVVAPNSGSAYWTIIVKGGDVALGNLTNILTFDTSGDFAGTYVDHGGVANPTEPTYHHQFLFSGSKTAGSPGNANVKCTVFYRLVVP